MAWFPKEVDLFWIHISFVYPNIYLSFYFEGPHSNFRYILVALKKDGNNVHFFDVLPHCGGGGLCFCSKILKLKIFRNFKVVGKLPKFRYPRLGSYVF